MKSLKDLRKEADKMYKEQITKIYIAEDGTKFFSESECLDYCKDKEYMKAVDDLEIELEDYLLEFAGGLDDVDMKEEFGTDRGYTLDYGRSFIPFLADKLHQKELEK